MMLPGDDVRLVRTSKGTPPHVNIYGYVYHIDTDKLSLVVEDKGASPACGTQANSGGGCVSRL